MTPVEVIEILRNAGWRQGDSVPIADNEAIFNACIDHMPSEVDDCHLLVVSQDCDIVSLSEKEPYIELIMGCSMESPDNCCLNGRNPRVLCMPFGETWLSCSANDRFRIRKDALTSFEPDTANILALEQRLVLRRWLASRYARIPFPDEFNRRLGNKLEKPLKSPDSKNVANIFIGGAEDELPPDQTYHITVLLAVLNTPSAMDCFERRMEQAFADCPGITLDDIQTLTEDDIPLSILRTHKRFEADYRSLPGDPSSARPAVSQ